MEKLPEETAMPSQEEAKKALQDYWRQRLANFEELVYPVFHERGLSKNTALLAYIMDELDAAVMVAVNSQR